MEKAMAGRVMGEAEGQAPDAQVQEVVGQYAAALQQLQARYEALEADKRNEARKLDIAEYEAETKRISALTRETRLPAGAYNDT